MKIYTCKDRLEDILTCIYDAWSAALQVGHDQIKLRKEPVFQQTIFDEYIHVDGDTSKAEKVIRSIRRMKPICMCIMHHCLMRKMHFRQFISSCELDLPQEAVYWSNMRIHL